MKVVLCLLCVAADFIGKSLIRRKFSLFPKTMVKFYSKFLTI